MIVAVSGALDEFIVELPGPDREVSRDFEAESTSDRECEVGV
jgi:hypothetical protein